MSAVVDFVEDVVGGVVEAVGDVVESVVDVVKDVGSAIDDYVIQPILDDPLTAIATVAGAAFLGPAIAPMLGTGLGAATGYVATGLGAAAGNTAAGLAQGEDFDDAVKGGLLAGVTAGATSAGFDYLTGAGAFGAEGAGTPSTAAAAAPDEALLTSAATPDEFLSSSASPVAEAFPVAPRPEIVATDLPPLTSIADDALTSGASGTSGAAASVVDDAVAPPSVTGPEVSRDWLTEGVKFPKTDGIAAREIPLDTPLKYNLDGSVDYGLMEPASADARRTIVEVPMSVNWKDVGSWPTWAETLPADAEGNRANARTEHLASKGVVVASDDPNHVVSVVGLDDVIVVRTATATLVCRADMAEKVKEIAGRVPPDVQ